MLALVVIPVVMASGSEVVFWVRNAPGLLSYGASLETYEDLDDPDEIGDLAVGAPASLPNEYFMAPGSVELIDGASGLSVAPPFSAPTSYNGDLFGYDIAALGDIDGGGTVDLLIGAPGSGFIGGSFVVHFTEADYGLAPGPHVDIQQFSAFGFDLGWRVGAMDADSDEYLDPVVTEPGAGITHVYSGVLLSYGVVYELCQTTFDSAVPHMGQDLAIVNTAGTGKDHFVVRDHYSGVVRLYDQSCSLVWEVVDSAGGEPEPWPGTTLEDLGANVTTTGPGESGKHDILISNYLTQEVQVASHEDGDLVLDEVFSKNAGGWNLFGWSLLADGANLDGADETTNGNPWAVDVVVGEPNGPGGGDPFLGGYDYMSSDGTVNLFGIVGSQYNIAQGDGGFWGAALEAMDWGDAVENVVVDDIEDLVVGAPGHDFGGSGTGRVVALNPRIVAGEPYELGSPSTTGPSGAMTLGSEPWVLGQSVTFEVEGAPGGAPLYLFVSASASPSDVPGFCDNQLHIGSAALVSTTVANTNGEGDFVLPLPDLFDLVGKSFKFQVFAPDAGQWWCSNGLGGVLGYTL